MPNFRVDRRRAASALALGVVAGLACALGACGTSPEWRSSAARPEASDAPVVALPAPSPRDYPMSGRRMARPLPGGSGAEGADGAAAGDSRRYATPNVARVTFAEEGADFDPCVSRDGERIFFSSTQHRSTADLYVKRANSRVLTRLTIDPSDDIMPALSPDGTRLAFASNRGGNWDIYIMPATGGKAVQVTSEVSDELHPTWSPDGSRLAFCRLGETSARWELWVAEIALESTPHFLGYGLFPKWCPLAGTGEDGADRILFQLGRERGRRTFGVWTMDYKDGLSGNAAEIIASAESALVNPTWSPDGQWIAYAEIPLTEPDVAGDADWSWATPAASRRTASVLPSSAVLWMIGSDGTGKVAVAAGGASVMPDWGFANRLYFVSNRGGTENIWSLDVGQAMKAASGNHQSPAVRDPIVDARPQPEVDQSR